VSSSGPEAIELAAMAGLELDAWQQLAVIEILGEREDGKWAAREAGVCVPRQNGKGGIIETVELAGLFLFGEQLITHSAHLFPTSLEAFRRLLALVEGSDELRRRVKKVSKSHGEEGIELYGEGGARTTGTQRIRFQARSKGAGRGFTGDRTIFDEAMDLPEEVIGNMKPTMSARPNPQTLYLGSAVDELIHDNGHVFARVRSRGLRGNDPSLVWIEYSVPRENPDQVTLTDALDESFWAMANPAFGIRIDHDAIADEQRSMASRTFAVERLGAGQWPSPEDGNPEISREKWQAAEEAESQIDGAPWFGIDVSPDRSSTSIAAAGLNADGLEHLELVDRRYGTGWVVERCLELQASHGPLGFVADGVGPVASLVEALVDAGVQVETTTTGELVKACGSMKDAVDQDRVRHIGQAELDDAMRGASTRKLGDAWAWARKNSASDISPLVAVTLARWKLAQGGAGGGFGFEAWA
jgi:hypothetical protein